MQVNALKSKTLLLYLFALTLVVTFYIRFFFIKWLKIFHFIHLYRSLYTVKENIYIYIYIYIYICIIKNNISLCVCMCVYVCVCVCMCVYLYSHFMYIHMFRKENNWKNKAYAFECIEAYTLKNITLLQSIGLSINKSID